MTEPAAFQATYSDWKVIKGRKVVQLVFEVPLEAADAAYQVLGGMPIAATEIWCGIARLKSKGQNNGGPEHSAEEATQGAGTPPADDVRGVRTEPGGPAVEDLRRVSGVQGAPAVKPDKPKSPAQVAGYLCTVPAFHRFLYSKYQAAWDRAWETIPNPYSRPQSDIAAECVRQLCKVNSRAELTDKNVEWNALRLAYQLWLNEPDLEITA